MSLTSADVKKVASLSKLRMDDAQLEKLAPEINKIVGFIEQLAEVDTDNVEPLSNVARKTLQLRSDVVNDGHCQDKVLANAPDSVEGYFAVSKVVE